MLDERIVDMTNEQLKAAHSARRYRRSRKASRDCRDADAIIVGIGERRFGIGKLNEITLTAAEIRAPILEALTARIDGKRGELKALGVS
jgi:hypothetical protein